MKDFDFSVILEAMGPKRESFISGFLRLRQNMYTRYEKARIVGARALQISLGAPVLIETSQTDVIKIAMDELKAGAIPMTVVRKEHIFA
jgi:DNA-directed RNA polymerase subunit K